MIFCCSFFDILIFAFLGYLKFDQFSVDILLLPSGTVYSFLLQSNWKPWPLVTKRLMAFLTWIMLPKKTSSVRQDSGTHHYWLTISWYTWYRKDITCRMVSFTIITLIKYNDYMAWLQKCSLHAWYCDFLTNAMYFFWTLIFV